MKKNERIDLRHIDFVTIDASDTKDIDDAVAVKKTDEGYKLFVAIADVSHYVKWESELDLDARKKSTSVYTLGNVQHMLPDELSQGECSLFENVDRYAYICEINYDNECNRIGDALFYEGIIHNRKQVDYKWANNLLEGKVKPQNELEEMVLSQLEIMNDMRAKLLDIRMMAGATIMERIEAKYNLLEEEDILELKYLNDRLVNKLKYENKKPYEYNHLNVGDVLNLDENHFAFKFNVEYVKNTFSLGHILKIKNMDDKKVEEITRLKKAVRELIDESNFKEKMGFKVTYTKTSQLRNKKIGDVLNLEESHFAYNIDAYKIYNLVVGIQKGDIKHIVPNHRHFSEKIVEEFMIAANNCAGIEVAKTTNLFLRKHDEISSIGIAQLIENAGAIGLKIDENDIFNNFNRFDLEKRTILNDMRLSVMESAQYVQKNEAHSGLGLEQYAQFTSPIRRYSDLIVHHIIKGNDVKITEEMVEHINQRKKDAQTEERQSVRTKVDKYYEKCYLGETLNARVIVELTYDDGGIKGYILGFDDGTSTFFKHFRGKQPLTVGDVINVYLHEVSSRGPQYKIVNKKK